MSSSKLPDPSGNRLTALIQQHPWLADTVLQCSPASQQKLCSFALHHLQVLICGRIKAVRP
jgi:hypothetical protein